MDHRDIPEDSFTHFLTLDEATRFMEGNPKPRLIDVDSTATYENGIPDVAVETALKVLRTLRSIAVKRSNHEADIHFGYTYKKLVLAAEFCNAEAVKRSNSSEGDSDARANSDSSTSEQQEDTPTSTTPQTGGNFSDGGTCTKPE